MPASQVTVQKTKQLVGQPIKRVEDPKFITGRGTYVDDVKMPHILIAAFVRSPHAHARIDRIDTSKAKAGQGVVAVLTGEDLSELNKLPTVTDQGERKATPRAALPTKEVNYVGEPVAVVLAEDSYLAEDAADLVEVDYDPMDAVVDVEAALRPDSPKVHDYLPNNISSRDVFETGDVKKAFASADEIIKVALLNQRIAVVPMETRAILSVYDAGTGVLTIYASTQSPHDLRNELAGLLKLSPSNVRLIAPDVGGGFGLKTSATNEDLVVCWASMKLNRPVKWIESRREDLLSATQGRGQKQFAEIAVRRDGKILGLKTRLLSETGAYATGAAVGIPGGTYRMGTGVYDISVYGSEVVTVLTNKVPQGAYRGAGRPEAAYLIERCMNVVARKLKLDPVKIRQVNFIKKGQFPFKTAGGNLYDSGDYDMNVRRALEVSDYRKLRAEQREARAQGRLVGVGIATYVEITGFGPGTGQSAAVSVGPTGEVTLVFGSNPHGQGHATPFEQILADELGIELGKIKYSHGDTGVLPWASGTGGSRSGPVGGGAVLMASRKVREKMAKIAANTLGITDGSRMVFADGKIFSERDPSKKVEFDSVAATAYNPQALPPGMEATIFEYAVFTPTGMVFPFGTHIAMVEVEKETGVVRLLKYFATDDIGKVLNPLIAEGQAHGGIVQGLGQAMLEQVIYDENGQPLTTTLADYATPSAEQFPDIVWTRTETPSPINPLGVKGIGEGVTTGATPTFVNAVEDALSPYDITVDLMPLRPDYVKSLIDGTHKPLTMPDLWVPVVKETGKSKKPLEEEKEVIL